MNTDGIKKGSLLWLYLAFIVIAIIIGVFAVVLFVAFLLYKNGYFPPEKGFIGGPLWIIVLFGLVISAGISLFIAKKIMKPIETLRYSLRKVANGDFSVRIEDESRLVSISEMNADFNAMAKELSSIETLRADFVANVSHEFKTPLSAIEGYATLLQNAKITEGRRREYVEKIISNTHALSTLTGNILKLSKLENQDSIRDKTTFSLDEQLRLAMLNLENEWAAKNIELDIDLKSVVYYGNETLLYLVWYNLIGNAIKFSKRDGKIEIRLVADDEKVTVKIKDYGCGIGAEEKKHIFDKFYQADGSHSGKGNGLGLALVKRIVILCNGEIFVESEINKGSVFSVILPL